MMFEYDLTSLEAHDEDIRLVERDRIIKLLEDERLLCSSEKYCWTSVEYKCECERTRALIKGEQK